MLQLVTKGPLLPRQQGQTGIEQTQLKILAQQEGLPRRPQCRLVTIKTLDSDQTCRRRPESGLNLTI